MISSQNSCGENATCLGIPSNARDVNGRIRNDPRMKIFIIPSNVGDAQSCFPVSTKQSNFGIPSNDGMWIGAL